MKYQVNIEPMQAHINDGKTVSRTFSTKKKAIQFFSEICIQYGYELREGFMDCDVEAGGIGHDFRITYSEIEETDFDITQYHHWGFAEWLNEEFKENPTAKISANIYHDETESVYYADLYVDDELCDCFYYVDDKEIYDDLRTARNQFSAEISDKRPLC